MNMYLQMSAITKIIATTIIISSHYDDYDDDDDDDGYEYDADEDKNS